MPVFSGLPSSGLMPGASLTSPLYTHDMAWVSATTIEFPLRAMCDILSFACRETRRGRDRGCLVIQTLA